MSPTPKKQPAFQFYPGAWLASVAVSLMSPEAEGTYIRLLARQWLSVTLPADPEEIRRLTKLSKKPWTKVWSELSAHFPATADGTGRQNPTLHALHEERTQFVEQMHVNGAKGGRPKKPIGSDVETKRFQKKNQNETSVTVSVTDSVTTTTHKADDGVVRAAYDLIAPAIGANGRDALRSLLAAVPDPESWARIIRGYASGQSMAQGRPAGAERLAAALEDFVAQGHHRTNPRPNLFRGFVTSAKSLPAPKERQMTIETDKADELLCLREQNVRRALVNEPPRPLPRWADEIDRMFPDGRTWPRGAAA